MICADGWLKLRRTESNCSRAQWVQRGTRSLCPKEHGSYGQIGLPLAADAPWASRVIKSSHGRRWPWRAGEGRVRPAGSWPRRKSVAQYSGLDHAAGRSGSWQVVASQRRLVLEAVAFRRSVAHSNRALGFSRSWTRVAKLDPRDRLVDELRRSSGGRKGRGPQLGSLVQAEGQ